MAVVIQSDGKIVSSGLHINGANLDYHDSMYVSSGGTATETEVNYGGVIRISSGGVASNTTVNYGGYMYISSGGVASNTTVSGGDMHISSGGVANNTTVNYSGYMYISSGGVANNTTVNGGDMYINYGGVASNTTVNNGYMYISSGGVASNTTVNSGGDMHISSGGVANNTTVNSNGEMYISSGGVASNTTVSNGGSMYISSGAMASEIVENGGYVGVYDGANVTFASNTVSGLTVNGSMTVHKNTIAEDIMLYYGSMHIYSGGVASNTTVSNGGFMWISSGGVASNTTVNGGDMSIYSGGVASNTTVSNGGSMHISSGGVANNTTVNNGGYMSIDYGVMASEIVENGGNVYVDSEANVTFASNTVSGLTIDSWMTVHKNTIAEDIMLNSNGRMYIYSGGVASNTTVNDCGQMWISSGGMAVEIIENGGCVGVSNGAKVTFASNTVSGLTIYGNMTVHKNTIAEDIVLNTGYMYIYSGGVANNTTVKGGDMYINYGGVASNTTVNGVGYMYIYSGGIHRGTLNIGTYGVVYAYQGSIIDFTVADRTAEDDFLITNLKKISGSATYTITVSDNQAGGQYKLATGADNFGGTVTIQSETETYGVITVNGEGVLYNNYIFRLLSEYGNLYLSVEEPVRPPAPTFTVSNEALTNQDVIITATFDSACVTQQYRINDGQWMSYTGSVTMERNGTVSFRGVNELGIASDVVSYTVANIDKEPPAKPGVSADITEPTLQNVFVTAVFSEDSREGEYSRDGGETWDIYVSPIEVTDNETILFRSKDAAGNYSDIVEYKVDNIRKYPPELTINGLPDKMTNEDITLNLEVTYGEVQYFNGSEWVSGSTRVISENSTLQVRVVYNVDGQEKIVEFAPIEITQIDKIPPTIEITGNITDKTNQDVVLSAIISDENGSYVLEYSTDGKIWNKADDFTYTATDNGTYYFRAVDEAGNISEVQCVVINNIDNKAPDLEISGNPADWTNQDVTLSAAIIGNEEGTVYYCKDDKWIIGSSMTVSENGNYQFKVIDDAGNENIVEVVVDKIDKFAPTLEVGSNIYVWTQKVTLSANVMDNVDNNFIVEYYLNGEKLHTGETFEVSQNGTYLVKVTDEAGNSSEQLFEVNNVDNEAPSLEIICSPDSWTNDEVTLSATVSDNSNSISSIEYSLDGENWFEGDSFSVNFNGTYYFRVTDEAGNVTTEKFVVDKIDKFSPTLNIVGNPAVWTNQDVTLMAFAGDNSDGFFTYEYSFDCEDWYKGSTLTVSENGTYYFRVTDEAGNESNIYTVVVDKIDKIAPVAPELNEVIDSERVSNDKIKVVFKDEYLATLAAGEKTQWSIDQQAWFDCGADFSAEFSGTFYFRSVDEAGNASDYVYLVIDDIDNVADLADTEYLFVSSKYNAQNTSGKKQNGIDLNLNENAFSAVSASLGNYHGEKIILVDAKNKILSTAYIEGVQLNFSPFAVSPVVSVKNDGTYSYKSSVSTKGTVEIVNNENKANFEHFATVNVSRSQVGVISGGKAACSHSSKNDDKYGYTVVTANYDTSMSASGKLTAINVNTYIDQILNYANVTLSDKASAGLIKNDLFSVKEKVQHIESEEYGNEVFDHTITRKVTPSGTVSLLSGAQAGEIYGFKTVKLDRASAGDIDFGEAYSEKYTLKNYDEESRSITYNRNGSVTAVDSEIADIINYSTVKLTNTQAQDIYQSDIAKIVDGVVTKKLTGKVTLVNSNVGNIENFTSVTLSDSSAANLVNVQKVTASKGFNFIESYVGTEDNDTLTINKNTVLTLGSADFGDGAKDKFVNNGTLIMTAAIDIDALPLSGKGEIAANADVWQAINNVDILNLGATAEGFRTTAYELADNIGKKASKWDIKSDYQGWLSGDSDCIDLVDFVKFKTGKTHDKLIITGFHADDTVNLNGATYTVDESEILSIRLDAQTDYVLELSVADGADSMMYSISLA